MAVMVAVTDSEEGAIALAAATLEARRRDTELLVADLRLGPVESPEGTDGVRTTVLEREPDVDVGDHVLRLLETRDDVELLVIGVKRRTPVGKLVLGSLSQRLLLEADVPVLAVKKPAQAR
ncbi:universal stress protein [Actinomadura miaoliensis]|uniref:Universal stress protein n=1 Tax=Actinomadura miaoliensis TaxID=430685 RepID=A0ABP7X1I3_9ACTN